MIDLLNCISYLIINIKIAPNRFSLIRFDKPIKLLRINTIITLTHHIISHYIIYHDIISYVFGHLISSQVIFSVDSMILLQSELLDLENCDPLSLLRIVSPNVVNIPVCKENDTARRSFCFVACLFSMLLFP